MSTTLNQALIRRSPVAALMSAALFCASVVKAEINVVIAHNDNARAMSSFRLKNIPSPPVGAAAVRARFRLPQGEADANSGGLEVLNDRQLPTQEDEPAQNFFFKAGTSGGRLLAELAESTEVTELNTYSWHPGTRGPQVYTVYASNKLPVGDSDVPKRPFDPATNGWQVLAKVDTRPNAGDMGGQYGVHIFDTKGTLGTFRYLLFDILPTENNDVFGNTFYSEIDIEGPSGSSNGTVGGSASCLEMIVVTGGLYRITVDTCATPDLSEWAKTRLTPVIGEWYPRLIQLLPSEGFEAPTNVSVGFSDTFRGVAATSGTRVRCAARWFRANLNGEAVGSVVHELVHVVQQYGRARREFPDASPSPGWLVEGLADYVRWFLYEPQSHGADVVWLRGRKNIRLRYDAGYRLTANFLNWVSEKYEKTIVQKLNVAMRQGKYHEEIWNESTGHTLADLGAEWKRGLEQQLGLDEQR